MKLAEFSSNRGSASIARASSWRVTSHNAPKPGIGI